MSFDEGGGEEGGVRERFGRRTMLGTLAWWCCDGVVVAGGERWSCGEDVVVWR